MTYFFTGVVVASVSLCSTLIYYCFGPGAFWNLDFGTSLLGILTGGFYAFLRVITWPWGIYVLIENPSDFFPWMFYHWYS